MAPLKSTCNDFRKAMSVGFYHAPVRSEQFYFVSRCTHIESAQFGGTQSRQFKHGRPCCHPAAGTGQELAEIGILRYSSVNRWVLSLCFGVQNWLWRTFAEASLSGSY